MNDTLKLKQGTTLLPAGHKCGDTNPTYLNLKGCSGLFATNSNCTAATYTPACATSVPLPECTDTEVVEDLDCNIKAKSKEIKFTTSKGDPQILSECDKETTFSGNPNCTIAITAKCDSFRFGKHSPINSTVDSDTWTYVSEREFWVRIIVLFGLIAVAVAGYKIYIKRRRDGGTGGEYNYSQRGISGQTEDWL